MILWLLLALLSVAAMLVAPLLVRGQGEVKASKRHLFPGSEGEGKLDFTARALLPCLLRLEWEGVPMLGVRAGDARAPVWGRHRFSLAFPYTPRGRGRHRLPRLHLIASDLFGFYEREVPVSSVSDEVLAYPPSFPLSNPALLLTLLAEGPEAPGIGIEDPSRFAGVRDYQAGDPPNRLHWPSTAKHGRLIVKDFARVRATGIWLHVDNAGKGKMGEAYLEHATSLAASLLRAADEEGFSVGLSVGKRQVPLSRGEDGLRRALELLANATLEDSSQPLPMPPAGVNLTVISYEVPLSLIEGALLARARAARVHFIALPEGFFLRPGEKPRPLYHRPQSVERLRARRALLEAEGVRVHLLRGDQGVWRLSSG